MKTSVVRPYRIRYLEKQPLDGQAVKNLAQAGMDWLEANREMVNALNVFPVPDGDTGTNMVLTMKSAMDEIRDSGETSAGKMLDKLANGALMGARGNSGVILSQLWRGFARAVEGKDLIDGVTAAEGFASARDTAYKGVVRPVEGTILTVAKDIAEAAETASKNGSRPTVVLEKAVEAAAISVERTPDLLPILKDAGVVDSGGKGLYFLLEGMVRWMHGLQLEQAETSVQPISALNLENSMEAVEEGQDYEVVVDFQPKSALDLEDFYARLEEMGTSIQVGEGDGMYRMHIHVPTEKRYEPIDYTMTLGTVTNVAIENLMAQMEDIGLRAEEEFTLKPIEASQIAVVAVAPGRGIAKHFADLGVAALVEGGQTMNPSTKDLLESFENLPNNEIIILPNNKNIMMAAQAAAEMTVKDARVIPAVNIPQGLAAMLRWAPGGDLDQVFAEMEAAISEVETGEVTTATRNVEIDGVEVHEGEIIALHNGKLVLSSENLEEAVLGLMEKIGLDDYELISLFYGDSIQRPQVEEIAKSLEKAYPDHEIEVLEGGQPHYQFIFSIE